MKSNTMNEFSKHNTVIMGKNTVTKLSRPELMRVEVEKTRRACEIGKNCGLFYVPEILDYNESKGIAVFERLDIKTVYEGVSWGKEKKILGSKLGKVLAIIHKELVLPDNMVVPIPEELSHTKNKVFVHGDLSVQNVCVDATLKKIIIIDWQMTPLLGGKATFGVRYFDILWFISNLITRPQTRFFFYDPVAPVANLFIMEYFKEAGISYDPIEFKNYALKFFEFYMTWIEQEIKLKSKGRAKLLWPSCKSIQVEFMKSIEKICL